MSANLKIKDNVFIDMRIRAIFDTPTNEVWDPELKITSGSMGYVLETGDGEVQLRDIASREYIARLRTDGTWSVEGKFYGRLFLHAFVEHAQFSKGG